MNTKMKMRMLSLLLCFVMLTGLMPTSVFAQSGTGTEQDPLCVTTFAELKAALEKDEDTWIVVNEFNNGNYYTLISGNDYEQSNSPYDCGAINIPTEKNKHLTINTTIDCRAVSTQSGSLLYCFINNRGNLTIDGSGTLAVSFNAGNYANAIIFNQGELNIDAPITLNATCKAVSSYGRAVLNFSGTFNISNGTYIGFKSKYLGTSGNVGALWQANESINDESIISGGLFVMTDEDGYLSNNYSLVGEGVDNLTLKGGTFYGIYASQYDLKLKAWLGTGCKYTYKNGGGEYNEASEASYTPAALIVVNTNLIPTVEMTVTTPVAGNNPVSPEVDTFYVTIDAYEWYKGNDKITASDTFEGGQNYTLKVRANTTKEFPNDVVVKVNGENATVLTVDSNNTSVLFEKSFTVPVSGYTLTFDANGGSGTMTPLTNAMSYTLPACTFTAPSGKQFAGWNVFGSEYDVGDIVYLSANTTAYAEWEDVQPIGYTLTFDANGGSGTMEPLTGQTSYTLPACTFTAPAGKQFAGWNVFGYTQSVGDIVNLSSNRTAMAIWENIPQQDQPITAINISCPGYVVGGNIANAVPTTSSEGVTIASYEWQDNNGTKLTSGTFAADTQYRLQVFLNVADGYTADSLLKTNVKINGVETTYFTNPCAGVDAQQGDMKVYHYPARLTAPQPNEYNVVITAGTGMSTTGNANQTVEQNSAITDVVYTAADGYYFPTDYSVAAQNGISVTRNSYTQITVSGTPTAAVNLTLTNATAKTQETTPSATFTAESENAGKLTGVDNTMKYSVDGGSNWLDITGDNMAITNVTTANGVQVKKPASDANTKLDSDPKLISVTKATAPTTATGVACTTNSNNDGKLQNVTNLMEYKKSDAGSWTDCGGTEVSGLVNGTYYVRVKATGTILASDYQEVQIAAYGVAALAGTVSIDGAAKFGSLLTANTSGITNNTGTLSYQWKRGSTNIGTNSATYTIGEDDIGSTITVTVTSSVETGEITSAATATIEKADGPAAPTGLAGVAPTTNGGSDGKITGTATTMEYSTDSSFTNPTGTVCQDTETTGFTAGTYYVRIKETTTHKAGAYATVTVPAYSISLDTTGTHTFTAATVGYAAQTAKTVTVSNTGNSATGPLTVALSGTDAASFELNKTSIGDIAVSGSDTFTVVPKTGLSAGTYTATVTVSGGNSINASFNVSFTVNPAGGGGGGGGYTPATYSLTVDKTENGSISISPKNAAKGDTVTVTVKPDEGYELDTLKVVDKNGNKVAVSEKNGKYTFTMPASKVTVTAIFTEIEQPVVNPFTDVKESDYYYEAVQWALKNGITDGTSANTFSPNANCTRAQIVTFLWRAAGSPAPKNSENTFTDLKADAYYHDAVLWAAEQGITSGTGGGKFSPEAVCTRSQSVTLLYHAAGSPKVSENASFSDVNPDAYYAAAVAWAEQNGVTGGIGGGLFGSANDCTRGQIVTFLYRFFVK